MKIRTPFLSVVYSIGQIALGLLLHPYQTLQSVVQEKVFVWMTFFPAVVLALIIIVWRVMIVPLAKLVVACAPRLFYVCAALPFFAKWIILFCFFWQVLLAYLFFRFAAAFRGRN